MGADIHGCAAQGGGFRLRLICAKQFGFVNYEKGNISLTPLGLRLVDPQQAAAAKVEAFLSVPLYRAIYDKFRGTTMPPSVALEREMVGLGVSPKQTDKARQAFTRSAKSAGFSNHGADRLVKPSIVSADAPPPPPPSSNDAKSPPSSGAGGGDGTSTMHPFIKGLIDKLPPPDSSWPMVARIKWLTTAANIFDLMYVAAPNDDLGVTLTLTGGSVVAQKSGQPRTVAVSNNSRTDGMAAANPNEFQ